MPVEIVTDSAPVEDVSKTPRTHIQQRLYLEKLTSRRKALMTIPVGALISGVLFFAGLQGTNNQIQDLSIRIRQDTGPAVIQDYMDMQSRLNSRNFLKVLVEGSELGVAAAIGVNIVSGLDHLRQDLNFKRLQKAKFVRRF